MPSSVEKSVTLPPAQEIRDAALEVVTRSEYDLSRKTDREYDFFEQISDFLDDLFSPFSSALDSLHTTSPVLWWVTVIALILLLLALVSHIIWSIYRSMKRKQSSLSIPKSKSEKEKSAEWWEVKAQDAVAKADYIGAIRFLFNGALIELERLSNSKVRRGATNREYLRRFQRSPVSHPLQTFVETIDNKWYGGQECRRTDYDECFTAYRAIQSAAKRRQSDVASA